MRAEGTETIAQTAMPKRGTSARGTLWELELLGRVWGFFTSVRLALVLILAIAAAVFAGTLIDQVPPGVLGNSAAYAQWLERERGRYGFWAGLFDALRLFNVFHSLWFRILIGLLVANVIVCSLNRWQGIWATAFGTRVRMGDAFFQHARFHASFPAAMSTDEAARRAGRALRGARYRVQTQADETSVAILADRNRFSRFGTYFSHLSLVLILAGALVGNVWGFSDPEFTVSEGATRELRPGSGIAIRLDHFTDEYYLAGPPKDYRSEISIIDHGVEVKRGVIRVNSPMTYNGYRIHQAFFGQTAVMEVKDGTGKVIFSQGVAQAWQTRDGSRPVGSFNLPDQDLAVYVIGPRSGENDPLVPAGEMRLEAYRLGSGTLAARDNLLQGTPKDLAGLTFTFARESRFTGLKIVKDPGVNIIWVAGGLMIVGLAMIFYFPHRRLWALCRARPDGTADVHVAMPTQRDQSNAEEFARVRQRMQAALGIPLAQDRGPEGGDDHV